MIQFLAARVAAMDELPAWAVVVIILLSLAAVTVVSVTKAVWRNFVYVSSPARSAGQGRPPVAQRRACGLRPVPARRPGRPTTTIR